MDTDPCNEDTAMTFDAVEGPNVFASYDVGKSLFEDEWHFAHIRALGGYYYRRWDGDFAVESEATMYAMFRNLYYIGHEEEPSTTDEQPRGPRRLPFLKRWIMDPRKKQYEDLVCDPGCTDARLLNTWRGLRAADLPPIGCRETVMELSTPLLDHMLALLFGVREYMLFTVTWMAFNVQRPADRTDVVLVLYGDQGTGKGIMFDFFGREVLGNHLYVQTDTMRTLFGEHATELKNKKLCQFDELSIGDTRPFMNRFKSFITKDKLVFNPKHKSEITTRNLVNYVLTTNNQNAVPIEPTDRRFVAFQCSSVHMQDTAYFSRLRAHMDRPDVQRAFYEYLRDHVDLSHVKANLQDQRPKTQYYRDLQQQNLPPLFQWLSWLCERANGGDVATCQSFTRVSSLEFLSKYKSWLEANFGVKQAEHFHGPQIGKDLRAMCCKGLAERPDGTQFTAGGVAFARVNGSTVYSFDFPALAVHMKKWSLYDHGAA